MSHYDLFCGLWHSFKVHLNCCHLNLYSCMITVGYKPYVGYSTDQDQEIIYES